MAVSINRDLTWQALTPLPFVLLAAAIMGQSVHQRFRAVQEKFSELTEFSQEILAGARVIKGFAAERMAISRFTVLSEANIQTNMVMAWTQAVYVPLTHIVPLFCYAIALYSGGRLIMDGVISIGDFTAFTGYLGLIIWPVMGLGYLINTVQRGLASLGRIAGVLTEPLDEQEKSSSLRPAEPTLTGPVLTIEHLSFSYPEAAQPSLRDVSLQIPAGAIVGIVGRTTQKEAYSDEYLFDPETSRYLTVLSEGHVFPEESKSAKRIAELDTISAILEVALQAEKDSILFYDELARNAKFAEAKTVFTLLKQEEQCHVVKLREMIDAWS